MVRMHLCSEWGNLMYGSQPNISNLFHTKYNRQSKTTNGLETQMCCVFVEGERI